MLLVFFLQDPFRSFVGTLRISTRSDDFTFIQNLGIAAGRVLVSASMGCHRSDRAQDAQMCHRVWMQTVGLLKRPNFLGLI
jgi:hypothetical protein